MARVLPLPPAPAVMVLPSLITAMDVFHDVALLKIVRENPNYHYDVLRDIWVHVIPLIYFPVPRSNLDE